MEDLVVAAGANGLHPRLNGLDLSRYIHRFEISAVDENGDPVVADRPMLARITHADNTRSWMGLPVRGSASQVFSATPQLEVFPTASGVCRRPSGPEPWPQRGPLSARPAGGGDAARPLRARPGRGRVVALEQLDRGALPASLGEGFDNISNRMSAWYEKSRFSAAEPQSDDLARFVLPGGGPHKVGLRVSLAGGEPQFVELGVVDIALVPGGDTVRVSSA